MTQQPFTNIRRTSHPRRPGFSLIEVLVVIGIIAILAALTVGGTFQFIETQRQSNTETNIRAIYQVLQQHWSKVVADARKEIPSPAALALAGQDQDRAMVIWVKLRLMEAFPANFTEILSTDSKLTPVIPGNPVANQSPLYYVLPAYYPVGWTAASGPYIPPSQQKYMTGYLKTLKQLGQPQPFIGSNPPRSSESMASLLIALQVNRSGAFLNPDSMGSSVVDTDVPPDGIKEIVDGWGTPLAFYRFPTANTELTTTYNANAAARFQDPLDAEGRLVAPAWYYQQPGNVVVSTNAKRFQKLCHQLSFPKGSYIVPVIASAGRDGANYETLNQQLAQQKKAQLGWYIVLGMNSPTTPWTPDPMNPATVPNVRGPAPISPINYYNDNIYSYRLQLGARGD